MNIIVTGGSGMVGSSFLMYLSNNKKYDLVNIYNLNKINFDFSSNVKVDITNRKEVLFLKKLHPEIIIHCAALTKISLCETHRKLAHKVNVIGTKNIVELSKITNAKLIYLSTDAVFDGKKGNYMEQEKPNPLTIYGKTKFEGENICLDELADAIVIRTNIFGINNIEREPNFTESILCHLKNNLNYNAFIDARFSPIYVYKLIKIIEDLEKSNADGIYHVSSNDFLTKYEFAKILAEIFNYDGNLIQPISVKSISKNIKYPKDLTLNNDKVSRFLKIKIPSVKEMMIEFKNDIKIKEQR